MLTERRASPRTPVHAYFNKYVDGVPYLCEALELSMTGMLVRRVNEPEFDRSVCAVEMAPGSEESAERVWMCATSVWNSGRIEALRFVGQSHLDRLRLADLVSGFRSDAASPVGSA